MTQRIVESGLKCLPAFCYFSGRKSNLAGSREFYGGRRPGRQGNYEMRNTWMLQEPEVPGPTLAPKASVSCHLSSKLQSFSMPAPSRLGVGPGLVPQAALGWTAGTGPELVSELRVQYIN